MLGIAFRLRTIRSVGSPYQGRGRLTEVLLLGTTTRPAVSQRGTLGGARAPGTPASSKRGGVPIAPVELPLRTPGTAFRYMRARWARFRYR